MIGKINIHDRLKKIEKGFKQGELTLDEYTREIINWNQDFSTILKAMINSPLDASHGGKLHKKQIIDKNGKKITKWISEEDLSKEEKAGLKQNGPPKEYKQSEAEKRYSLDDWQGKANKASEIALKNAAKFAGSEEIRRIARNELLKRNLQVNKHMDMSLLPDFMLDSYIQKYEETNKSITKKENESIAAYRDFGYASINKKLRDNKSLDKKEEKQLKDIDSAIDKSELQHDIVLHRGINGNGKEAMLFAQYLGSLQPGDIYEEQSFSSSSLIQGQAHKFKDLYSSIDNKTIKIYASKGQKALCMQNLGGEDEKKIYNDEYEFLLPRNSKFQVFDNKDGIISVKLL